MRNYKLINNITGWLVFAVAAITYCLTIEPTASFWDCPEFITTADKLEVGHPPGAPFFMLFGKFFTLFASDQTQVAVMVNIMSALLSAGCILFLFWSITHLAKKLIHDDVETMTLPQLIAIMASGVGGALIYTWSDTFWFSAVEGEVYAFSSFFTALVFWLILKWEDNADNPHSDKWLVLISYLVGLSIGVHLLNLLCIPAIVLVFYFKKAKEATLKGSLLVLAVSVVIVAAVLYGMVPGIMKVSGWFELLFVNGLGMSFDTGLYFYILLLVCALVWGLYTTHKKELTVQSRIAFLVCTALLGIPFYGHGAGSVAVGFIVLIILGVLLFKNVKITSRLLNTTLLCMTLITVGYSSYAVIVIRSTANPPMDQNSPEDVFTLAEYLGREQYGDRPLFFGQTYASMPDVDEAKMNYKFSEGAPRYMPKEKKSENEPDEYVNMGGKIEYVYPSDQCMLFPRIYNSQYARQYENWLGDVDKKTVPYAYTADGSVQIPTFAENMKFFISYQVNFMYWRYFLWNFAGRQNDIQGNGELEHGNWITGFSFIDNAMLGDQSKLPSDLRENKGHNVFYCLPLILGLLGFFWQAFRGRKGIQQFWVVFFLFFMTGLAIVFYLNQTPGQPRERDYAYAGSFYAFAIWCGLGVSAIYEWIKRGMKDRKDIIAASLAVVPALAVPLQMVSQTWDDHDRSGRYVCRDFGLNYLETVPHDGVIFTNGDNDTFPLWYNEDTEGNRTDVRVCNLSYLQTDWYIDQMKRPAFEGKGQSSPLPISWKKYEYATGENESVDVNPTVGLAGGKEISMKEMIRQMYAENPETAKEIWGEEPFELNNAIQKFVLKRVPEQYKDQVADIPPCLPSDTLYLNVDKEAVRKSGMKIENDSIPDRMIIDLSGRHTVYKNFMMMLEMIGQSNFKRPLYMSTTVGPDNYGSLFKHFIQEGIAWRFTPFTYPENQAQRTVVDTEKMYDNMMNKYKYGNLKQKGLYIDETTQRMCFTHRRWFSLLIKSLMDEGKRDKALKALEKCEAEIPEYNIPHDPFSGSIEMATAYMQLGKIDKAEHIMNALKKRSEEYANWYLSLNDYNFTVVYNECYAEIITINSLLGIYDDALEGKEGYKQFTDKETKTLQQHSKTMERTMNQVSAVFIDRCQKLGIQLQ